MNCLICDHNAQRFTLPPREHVASDDHWRVAHAFGTGTPGWLVLAPLRHVTAIAELTRAEAELLGSWQVRLSRALPAVTGCAKTYIAQFAEAEGFAHVHFHVIPRMPDQPEERRGPRVFDGLGRPEEDDLSPTHRDELAVRLRRELTRSR
ncbi:HIT family protein [Actinomadura sp. WMMB 499]|uniref:HIT family protein n=1 Tax=Actinomadura sp. WMMB 499 TaxID=1219491 RepID=UPI0012487C42|nr:HIT family protein [Actinomadura sp. WMMB 499]QFG21513.1 HIT family protein [Actinomadura sp. WMMB 499]